MLYADATLVDTPLVCNQRSRHWSYFHTFLSSATNHMGLSKHQAPHILQYTIIFLTQNCYWWGTPHFWEAKLDSAHWALAYFFSFDGDSCFPNILVRQRGIPGPCISFSGTLILFSEPCIWPNYNRVRPHWNDSMMVSKGKFYLSQCSSLISSLYFSLVNDRNLPRHSGGFHKWGISWNIQKWLVYNMEIPSWMMVWGYPHFPSWKPPWLKPASSVPRCKLLGMWWGRLAVALVVPFSFQRINVGKPPSFGAIPKGRFIDGFTPMACFFFFFPGFKRI